MKSNVSFNSNIYPVVDNVTTDRQFLSKVIDFNRLKALSKRVYISDAWSEHQKKIIEELPYCHFNPDDPCWGMISINENYVWECKCTNSECRYLDECRKGKALSEEEKEQFTPLQNQHDDFGYDSFIRNYFAYPVRSANLDIVDNEQPVRYNKEISTTKVLVNTTSVFLALSEENTGTGYEDERVDSISEPKTTIANVEQHISHEETSPSCETITNTVSNMRSDSLQNSSDALLPVSAITTKNIFADFQETTQETIICSESSQSFFVDAGPGTGKTYTLINKLNYMVTKLGVNPECILVLCFTNAAVNEIKRRLKGFVANGGDRGLANVDIRTFHSFSWWLINQANELFVDEGWQRISLASLTYESSLIVAKEIMRRFGNSIVENWEYFIVDEVQDLTNSLGYFVLQIVRSCMTSNCGVTVFGDACQAIYDYTVDNTQNPLSSEQFYRKMYDEMYGKTNCLILTENHRQNGALLENTNGFRKAILSGDFAKMKKEVEYLNSLYDSSSKITLESIQKDIDTCLKKGNVCLLFRDNATALKMSSDFRKRDIAHTLNISETNKNYAAWIADVFGNYERKTVDYSAFESLYDASDSNAKARDVWERMQNLLHIKDEVIDVRSLLDAVSVSKIDDPYLRDNRDSSVVVSNIHRAKGREFDSVILEKSFVDDLGAGNVGLGEYKTFYVAITRAKSNLYLSPLKGKTHFQKREIYATGRTRWVASSRKKISYFEFDSEKDLVADNFASVDISRFNDVKIGDEIILKREIVGKNINYSIIHNDTSFGFIGRPFIDDIMAYMHIDRDNLINMPSEIGDLYVSGVYSMVVTEDYLKCHPEVAKQNKNGIWKWIEIVGIGHLSYDVY